VGLTPSLPQNTKSSVPPWFPFSGPIVIMAFMRRSSSRACRALAFVAILGLAGCGSDSPQAEPSPSLVEARPYGLKVPAGYGASTPTPLVLLLHGYTGSGFGQAQYFGMLMDADQHGYLLAYPDGTEDPRGNRFWNATDACCNFYGSPVDDVAYLVAVLDDVEAHYSVDLKRVYVVGHSNGGFMAHRLACDIGQRLAAAVSLAGSTWPDPDRCSAPAPVNVLQIHGDRDQTIFYGGTSAYPSAERTLAIWAQKNRCAGTLDPATPDLDLDVQIPGAETLASSYGGCPAGGSVDLWRIVGGGHVPSLDSSWADHVWTYLAAHPKP
jgi:polyhydroxybutyrate depolymerase